MFLFGYNVYIGLQSQTHVSDVFSLHRYEHDGDSFEFVDAPEDTVPGLLADEKFRQEFAQLYRYYRDTSLLQLRRIEERLLAVFQTGPRTEDVRVLRWSISPTGEITYMDDRGERDHVGDLAGGRDRQDRKSTRLNSSHVATSYAVCCLKKKR